jgi:hypothetical protein
MDPLVEILGKVGLGRSIAAGVSVPCVLNLLGVLAYAIYQRADSFTDQLSFRHIENDAQQRLARPPPYGDPQAK